MAGVGLVLIDPRNTSRACSKCGHCEKANRKQSKFECKICGHAENADYNAAKNIKTKGYLSLPIATNVDQRPIGVVS
jgi:putative transposase